MTANEAGMRAGLDPEFLHDYRVAVRRARSALAQVKGVLPERPVQRFREELAWLGAVTSPPRDLDVYLLALPEFRRALPERLAGELDPVAAWLEEARDTAYGALREALASPRYRRLREGWEAFVAAPPPRRPAAPRARMPVEDVASRRIWKLYKRVLREGAAIDDDSPDADLHELRKTCKKLRYLMEMFRALYPAGELNPLITTLKAFQDNLGEHQDLAVQAGEIARIRGDMAAAGRLPPASAEALEHLAAELARRRDATRAEFRARFAAFATRAHRERFRALFRGADAAA
jgi:CHAD domain-containing protein